MPEIWPAQSVQIGTDPAGPADPRCGFYQDPKSDFEEVHFLDL